MDANSTGLVIGENAAVIIAEGLLSHYEGAKGRKSPSKGVESGKTGDQRLMLNAAIHRLIHRPSITASLMGENHPYKKS